LREERDPSSDDGNRDHQRGMEEEVEVEVERPLAEMVALIE
jgi:hypothetical protein